MTLATINSPIACDRRERAGPKRRQQGCIAALVGAAALAMASPANLARADPASTNLQLHADCPQVYHPEACRCAAGSMQPFIPGSLPVAEQRPQVAAESSGPVTGRVEAARVPVRVTRDFVQLVQACMSPGSDAPAD